MASGSSGDPGEPRTEAAHRLQQKLADVLGADVALSAQMDADLAAIEAEAAWVPGGNSLKQEEARRRARAALAGEPTGSPVPEGATSTEEPRA